VRAKITLMKWAIHDFILEEIPKNLEARGKPEAQEHGFPVDDRTQARIIASCR